MQITGLACPYRVTIAQDWEANGTSLPRRANRMQFAHGAFARTIHNHTYVEIVVNGVWREHLASTKHGLLLFETCNGLYFHAELPNTPYAKAIYEAICGWKIRHVCQQSSGSSGDLQPDGSIMIWNANLMSLSLLMAGATAHFKETWITSSGVHADKRIEQEVLDAEARHLTWALDPARNADDIENIVAGQREQERGGSRAPE